MNDLELADGFWATPDRFLWLPASATAILSDVHLGVEDELSRHGLFMPVQPLEKTPLKRAWNAVAARLTQSGAKEPRLIIAGDFFDSPNPSATAIADAHTLFNALPPNTRVTLLAGNHDPTSEKLESLITDPRIHVAPATSVANYLVMHGHEAPPTTNTHPCRGFIVGHQHPAVVLRNSVQSAKMICFAHCTLRVGKKSTPLLILPTFSPMPLGSNLMTERYWILSLPQPTPADIRIAGIVRDRVLDFGTLGNL